MNSKNSTPSIAGTVDQALEQLGMRGLSRRDFSRLLAGTLAIGAGGSFIANSASPARATQVVPTVSKVGRVALLSWSISGRYQTQWAAAFQGAAAQLGLESVVLDGQYDASVQLNQFNQLLTQKTVGIFIGANDASLIPNLSRLADERRIFFSNAWNTQPWFTPWNADGYYSPYITPDERTAVAPTIDKIAEAIGGDGSIVRVGNPQGDSVETIRRGGVLDGLSKHTGLTLVGELHGQATPELAQQSTAALLTRYPDARAVVAFNDDVASGAIAAIRQLGKEPGKDIFVVGTDGTAQAIEAIQSGAQLATTGGTPAYPAYTAVTWFYDRLNGWKPDPAELSFSWHPVIVTKENVTQFKSRYFDLPEGEQFSADLLSRTRHPQDFDLQFDAFPNDDLDRLFQGFDRPEGYQLPAAYVVARDGGGFDRIRKLYKDHYKTSPLDPSPFKAEK